MRHNLQITNSTFGDFHSTRNLAYIFDNTLKLVSTTSGKTYLEVPYEGERNTGNPHIVLTDKYLLGIAHMKDPICIDLDTLEVKRDMAAYAVARSLNMLYETSKFKEYTTYSLNPPVPFIVKGSLAQAERASSIRGFVKLAPEHYLAAVWEAFPKQALLAQYKGMKDINQDSRVNLQSFADEVKLERIKGIEVIVAKSHFPSLSWSLLSVQRDNENVVLNEIGYGAGIAGVQNGILMELNQRGINPVKLRVDLSKYLATTKPMEMGSEVELL